MKLKLYQIKKEKDKIAISYTEDLTELVKGMNQVIEISPVEVKGEVKKEAGVFTLRGTVQTDVTLQCSRCLTNFIYHLNKEMNEFFIPEDVQVNWASEEEGEDENVHILTSDEIDLTSIVEEEVILSIPYVPVCHEECKGLCSACGINLNEKSCDCKTEKVDPRLADLAKWFDENDSTE